MVLHVEGLAALYKRAVRFHPRAPFSASPGSPGTLQANDYSGNNESVRMQ